MQKSINISNKLIDLIYSLESSFESSIIQLYFILCCIGNAGIDIIVKYFSQILDFIFDQKFFL